MVNLSDFEKLLPALSPGEKAQILIGRPATHPLDCGKLVRDVLTPLGGRGGGQPAMAQGGIPDPAQLAAAVAMAGEKIRTLSAER